MKAPEKHPKKDLSARARQVLDVIYRIGEVSAADILREVPDVPSYSAVRSILRALEKKGLVQHHEKGLRYVYLPTTPKEVASRSAMERLLDTFFEGSPEYALQALVDVSRERDTKIDFDQLEKLIQAAAQEGR
ncbi:MAG: BlaI/MecI/CopY family transcriptional regulator [Deltaproteobacteria bacterium]|nr:BlaI/MecI/CopY family transcriptional regulator [Deltaproteobacteria bacterium]